MNYHDSQWRNNERNYLDSYFSFLKPLLKAFKFIYILKIIQLTKVLIHMYGFSTGISLNIFIICGKDPDFQCSNVLNDFR